MINDIEINFTKKEGVDATILIEGLPGIGQVGKLVAEYMIDELGAEKIAEIYSIYFPPHVIINADGVARLINNELYYYGSSNKILFLVGDYQSATNEGHYLLVEKYLNIAQQHGVKRIYTLGGYGVGHLVDVPRVLAAVNMKYLVSEVLSSGAIFNTNEPGTGIVGASGLLLGMSVTRNMEAICLMGETSGYLVDPKSAKKLLEVLCKLLQIEIDSTRLERRATEMEQFIEKLREERQREIDQENLDDDLRYIG